MLKTSMLILLSVAMIIGCKPRRKLSSTKDSNSGGACNVFVSTLQDEKARLEQLQSKSSRTELDEIELTNLKEGRASALGALEVLAIASGDTQQRAMAEATLASAGSDIVAELKNIEDVSTRSIIVSSTVDFLSETVGEATESDTSKSAATTRDADISRQVDFLQKKIMPIAIAERNPELAGRVIAAAIDVTATHGAMANLNPDEIVKGIGDTYRKFASTAATIVTHPQAAPIIHETVAQIQVALPYTHGEAATKAVERLNQFKPFKQDTTSGTGPSKKMTLESVAAIRVLPESKVESLAKDNPVVKDALKDARARVEPITHIADEKIALDFGVKLPDTAISHFTKTRIPH